MIGKTSFISLASIFSLFVFVLLCLFFEYIFHSCCNSYSICDEGNKILGLFIFLTFSRFSSDDLIELSQVIIANCILGIL